MSILNFILSMDLFVFGLNQSDIVGIATIATIVILFILFLIFITDPSNYVDDPEDNYVDGSDDNNPYTDNPIDRPNLNKTIVVSKDLESKYSNDINTSLVNPNKNNKLDKDKISKPSSKSTSKTIKQTDNDGKDNNLFRWIRIEKGTIIKSLENLGKTQKVSDLTHSDLENILRDVHKSLGIKFPIVYSPNTLSDIAKAIGISTVLLSNYFNKKPVSSVICEKIETYLLANTKNRILSVKS